MKKLPFKGEATAISLTIFPGFKIQHLSTTLYVYLPFILIKNMLFSLQ